VTRTFLFVRPPRPLWPFNGPSTAFWPPLAFASLAAALRDGVREVRVVILDAPTLHMGWRTLGREIQARRPAWVGIGEEAVSCVEGLRVARLAKDAGATVVAGGCFFGHVAGEALATGSIDIVVHGEGEQTIVELVDALQSGARRDLARVAGISFLDGEEVVTTPPRALLADLDRLPMPAYDLLPVERYGARSRNHPDLASIELGRGCVGACGFCVLWRQMGRTVGNRVVPHLRTKSPERLLEEVRRLTRRFNRRYLAWVDPCFNADARVPGELAERLRREGIAIGQSAWVRADCLVRDARSGVLARLVDAGLNEVYLGVERPDADSLHALNKTEMLDDTREAFARLRRDHPHVFTVGSFIYGVPGDTPESVRAMYRFGSTLGMDKTFFIPLAPLPGTAFWRPELWDPTGAGFRAFDFLPSAGDRSLSRALLMACAFDWTAARVRSNLARLVHPDARKRRMARHIFLRSTSFAAFALLRGLAGSDALCGMVLPKWYES
jgi:anaerobic magnesium-protoporphyrin IX monomethyl ester cyclase